MGKSNANQLLNSRAFLLEDENGRDIVYDKSLKIQYSTFKPGKKLTSPTVSLLNNFPGNKRSLSDDPTANVCYES